MHISNEKEIFGNNIQILINQRNWTIQRAADELKYDRNKLSRILTGSQNFELKTVIKFARFFNISVFLLFNRLFENDQYRILFPFVESDYMFIFRKNFESSSLKQSEIDLDSTTVSHIICGRRNNPTIDTLCHFTENSKLTLSELFKTEIDKSTEQHLTTIH